MTTDRFLVPHGPARAILSVCLVQAAGPLEVQSMVRAKHSVTLPVMATSWRPSSAAWQPPVGRPRWLVSRSP